MVFSSRKPAREACKSFRGTEASPQGVPHPVAGKGVQSRPIIEPHTPWGALGGTAHHEIIFGLEEMCL